MENLILSTLVYIMETTLTEEEECTIENIIGFIKMNTLDLNGLEEAIGYKFKDKGLLKQALTHSSYANEQKTGSRMNNERMWGNGRERRGCA